MVISPAELKKILFLKERSKIDFKETFVLKSKPLREEFAKDVSAMANTSGRTGFLIYSITNDMKVRGIDPSSFKEEQMQQIISSKCDPPVKFSAYTIQYLGQYIGIIEIPHSMSSPHQHLSQRNFFIRRGSTTDKMSTQEIVNAVIRRVQIEKSELGSYDSSSPSYRVRGIRKDIVDILDEFDYKYSKEIQKIYPTHSAGTKIVLADEVENIKKKIRFHVSVYGDTVTYYDMERYRLFTREVSDNFIARKNTTPWLNIFLIASYESITKNTIKKSYDLVLNTFARLGGSTIYYGLGDTDYQDKQASKKIKSARNLIPEFYITRVRSVEDIRTRLTIIFDYINEKADVFRFIRNSQSKPREK